MFAPPSRYGIDKVVTTFGSKWLEQSKAGYVIVKVFVNAEAALFPVHCKQRVFEYPSITLFEALIYLGEL